MAQMQTLSARLPTEDVEWLASIDIPGATTASDKLRALVARSRQIQESTADFQTSLAWAREMVSPLLAAVGTFEHRKGVHSEALRLVAESAPQLMALLLSGRNLSNDPKHNPTQLEDRLVAKSMQLATALLRLAITPKSPCYDPAALDRHVLPMIELSFIVSSARGLNMEK